jgi:asparagine synthase (glutamine-hydrolysing)
MCGITGILKLGSEKLSSAELESVKLALDAQAHRGPDAKCLWSDSHVAFGHNRLSIIDLSTSANQPFYREDLGLTIVFNGEIYNYQELKEDLLSKNYHFLTSSDTEVLLVAYKEYGEKLTEHLRGMFAFFIFNHENRKIFAARDRFGEKPIFFIQTADTFYFASELGALKKLFPKQLTINQNAVIDLMENMYINLQHTIYQEVEVFQPAHQLVIENGKLNWDTYYNFPKVADYKPGFESLKSQVKEKLFQIIESELHADVPVATFLSSGIDSSVVTAISKEIKPDILAITMSTGEAHSDEASDATEFAKKLGIHQEIIKVNPGSLEVLGKLLKTMQPLADASLIPTHLVTESIASHTKVMLSGDGGDEVFGSYNKPNLFTNYGKNPLPMGSLVFSGFSFLNSDKKDKYLNDKNRFKLKGWDGFYSKNNISSGFEKIFRNGKPQNLIRKKAFELLPFYAENPEKLSFGVDALTRLPSDFLLKVDSAAMRSSIEVRAPFLDHTLIDLSFQSDLNSLMPHQQDKEITREIYQDFAGKSHQGSKKGFSIPYQTYLIGSWGDLLEKLVQEEVSSEYFQFNITGILNLLQEFRASPGQRVARILFSLLVLEIWLRVFHLEQEIDLKVD